MKSYSGRPPSHQCTAPRYTCRSNQSCEGRWCRCCTSSHDRAATPPTASTCRTVRRRSTARVSVSGGGRTSPSLVNGRSRPPPTLGSRRQGGGGPAGAATDDPLAVRRSALGGDELGDLDGVERGALAQVVVGDEQRQAAVAVLADAADVGRVLAGGLQRGRDVDQLHPGRTRQQLGGPGDRE